MDSCYAGFGKNVHFGAAGFQHRAESLLAHLGKTLGFVVVRTQRISWTWKRNPLALCRGWLQLSSSEIVRSTHLFLDYGDQLHQHPGDYPHHGFRGHQRTSLFLPNHLSLTTNRFAGGESRVTKMDPVGRGVLRTENRAREPVA